jgi:hypothetical protein
MRRRSLLQAVFLAIGAAAARLFGSRSLTAAARRGPAA